MWIYFSSHQIKLVFYVLLYESFLAAATNIIRYTFIVFLGCYCIRYAFMLLYKQIIDNSWSSQLYTICLVNFVTSQQYFSAILWLICDVCRQSIPGFLHWGCGGQMSWPFRSVTLEGKGCTWNHRTEKKENHFQHHRHNWESDKMALAKDVRSVGCCSGTGRGLINPGWVAWARVRNVSKTRHTWWPQVTSLMMLCVCVRYK